MLMGTHCQVLGEEAKEYRPSTNLQAKQVVLINTGYNIYVIVVYHD